MPIGFQLRASTLAFSPAMRIAFACVLFGSASLLRSVSAYEGGSNAAPTKSTSDGDLKASFDSTVLPFFQKYCMDCHDTATAEAKLDVSVFRTPSDIHGAWGSWQAILSRVHEGEMPPADSSDQPTTEERRGLEAWSEKFRISEAARRAGDPGPISTRRLSNSEYNYTIRDLTGVDIQPTASFPIDAANRAGFDNSAESLTISPALISKYLDAARSVADHMLLTPNGIRFAPHPVVTDTDRDKYCVQRIVDFYRAQPTSLDQYLLAAWEFQFEQAQTSLPQFEEQLTKHALSKNVSPQYLKTVWNFLHNTQLQWGPGKKLQERFRNLPSDREQTSIAEKECRELAAWISSERKKLKVRVSNLSGVRGMNGGSQSLVLWKNRKMASSRRQIHTDALNPESKDCVLPESELEAMKNASEETKNAIRRDYESFGSIFPDAFLVLERGRAHISEEEAAREAKGRLLSAGFHSMMGFFRDDQPLCELILNDEQRKSLDSLWDELSFISHVPTRQYSGFIWFERAEGNFISDEEFHFVRAEDKSAFDSAMIKKFADAYIAKLRRLNASTTLLDAVEFHFRECDSKIRSFDAQWSEAKPKQLESLLAFATKAFRRPLSIAERKEILDFYHSSIDQSSGDHRVAMEDTLVYILVSPSYLYRWDLQGVSKNDIANASSQSTNLRDERSESRAIGTTSDSMVPLSNLELASRLSYFLWSSAPDDELLRLAADGSLNTPENLASQTKRMLGDLRAKSMLLEFLGNWLEFRRFDQHQAVDRNQFPSFDDELRRSMWQEPIEFLHYLIGHQGTVADILHADFMIVDGRLANHYAVKDAPPLYEKRWTKVSNASQYQRGGLLSMAVFLTQNSPGLRTSPVKRGYWVVRRLLGELIPPPPPNVPELPNSDQQLGDKTLREALAIHREHASCAACHNRFDSAGLLLEGFDPIGRPRENDLAGRPVQTDATLPDGSEAMGIDGLRDYIRRKRMDDFRRHFCESLLAFALGRTLILSDDLLVDELIQTLEKQGDRIDKVFEQIVLSPQFRYKRVQVITSDEGVSP
ncbi:MAG: DUF1592 domain-containing protein [Pirellula sp.]|nr:DUF1592 domain-containing protein [Pirellula sp.]